MLTFVEWVKQKGFYVREAWDIDTGKMIGTGRLTLLPHQEEIFDLALNINESGIFDYQTIVYSCLKKSGKTSLAAAVGAWYAEEVGGQGTEIYCIANDLEQAEGRIMRDIKFHFQKRIENRDSYFNNKTNREMFYTDKNTSITLYNITLPNDTFIQALASSYKSVAGARHSLTLWDELWGATSELSHRVWDEMTPIPTIPNSLRFIATYAGFENESDLLWDIYVQGVDKEEHEHGKATRIHDELPLFINRRMFTYWDHEPRMPWQTDAYYEEQMETLRPAAYLRLHQNQWVTSHEQFIPVEWFDIAARAYHAPATIWGDHPYRGFPITIGVDAGVKRDTTALVGVAYDSKRGKVGQVFHKIWTPSPGDQIDLDATVEQELIKMNSQFNIASIVYDPTHLLQTMLRLEKKGFPTNPYQQSIPNMTQASQLLYDLFKNRSYECYPDDLLRTHIQMAVAETTSRGFRIVKNKTSRRHHIDGAIAMAMASYDAVRNGGVDTSIPLILESPYSDATEYVVPRGDEHIPFALR